MTYRILALVVLAACLSASAYWRRRARQTKGAIARREEGPVLIAARLAVGLPLFGGALAYVVNPRWMAWASVDIPDWACWLGVAVGLLTVPAVHWVLGTLGANVSETVLTKSDHRLVTEGPYRWIRHPLYTTGVALFLSIGTMAANWFIVLWAMIALVGIRLVVIPREEAELISKFGERYRQYQRCTGSMLPSLRRSRAGECA